MQLSIDTMIKNMYFVETRLVCNRRMAYCLSPIYNDLYVIYSWRGRKKSIHLTDKIQIARHLNKLERMFNIIIPPFGAV